MAVKTSTNIDKKWWHMSREEPTGIETDLKIVFYVCEVGTAGLGQGPSLTVPA